MRATAPVYGMAGCPPIDRLCLCKSKNMHLFPDLGRLTRATAMSAANIAQRRWPGANEAHLCVILTGWRGGRQVRLRRMERAVNHKRPPSDGESDPCLGACGLPERAFVVRFAWNLAGMTYATRPSFWRMRRTVKHFRAVATVDRVKHTAFQA